MIIAQTPLPGVSIDSIGRPNIRAPTNPRKTTIPEIATSKAFGLLYTSGASDVEYCHSIISGDNSSEADIVKP